MDFSKLKELAKTLGGILVMNGNEPELVIMPYEKYVPAHQPAPSAPPQPDPREEELIDSLNKEILALKEEIRQKEAQELEQTEPEGEVGTV